VEVVRQQQQLNSLRDPRGHPSWARAKWLPPWAGKANLENLGEPIGVEGDDFSDSGIGSLSEPQVREFDEWGGIDWGAGECEEGQDGSGRRARHLPVQPAAGGERHRPDHLGHRGGGARHCPRERAVTLENVLSYCTEDLDS